MSGIQVVGNLNNTTAAEVETNTKALRTVVRPDDYGSNGIYALAGVSGTLTSIAAAPSNVIFSFRTATSTSLITLVKQVRFSMFSLGTGFTAGSGHFDLDVARSFTAADSGGTNLLTGIVNKLRTSGMATTSASQINISTTTNLTNGTRTLDAQSLAQLSTAITATVNNQFIQPGTMLWDARVGEMPLVLAQSEGFVISAVLPATGTWGFNVNMIWEELASY